MHVNNFAIICLEFWQISTHVLSSSDPNWFTYQVLAYLTETRFYHVHEIYTHCDSFFFPGVSFDTYPISLLVA